MTGSVRSADERLLDAIQTFVAGHQDPALRHFAAGIADWGTEWVEVPPADLPIKRRLVECLDHAVPETRDLLSAFVDERDNRHWEQSYSKADNVVGDDMLSDYGFTEVIGKRGPFVSERVRTGIGLWGPNILYPVHNHAAEEVYFVLAGGAEFQLGEGAGAETIWRGPGEAVFVASNRRHAIRILDRPLVVFYIWSGGDLRQISSFS